MIVDQLLEEISKSDDTKENELNAKNSQSQIVKLVDDLVEWKPPESSDSSPSAASSSTEPKNNESEDQEENFDELIGYYNVSYTLTSKPKENPVGGKWTRSQRLLKIQRTMQHVLPLSSSSSTSSSAKGAAVAQVINAIFLECFWGLLPIWIVLRGDAVPLNKIPKEEPSTKATTNKGKKKKSPPSLLPGLSPRTVRAYFDSPRFAIGKFVFSFGPTSSVVLDTPYIDDRIRLGVGGTSGTKFVFSRIKDEQDNEAVDGWKWVLEKESTITKTKASYGLLWTSLLSGFAYKSLRFGMGKIVASTVFLASLVSLGLVMASTGGIETNSDNYTPGVAEAGGGGGK
ncbi:unnamed protein product [Cylindrotheca closterium]|uniref:Uncharacterized protein n=1 Tax=Cylindrotheca closterium TaxID=2856 RepID=A0AAD2FDA4_9STRA|nr:unnamed protein product [Cylindrotheca closterium]